MLWILHESGGVEALAERFDEYMGVISRIRSATTRDTIQRISDSKVRRQLDHSQKELLSVVLNDVAAIFNVLHNAARLNMALSDQAVAGSVMRQAFKLQLIFWWNITRLRLAVKFGPLSLASGRALDFFGSPSVRLAWHTFRVASAL